MTSIAILIPFLEINILAKISVCRESKVFQSNDTE
jgi:hypothetical protein